MFVQTLGRFPRLSWWFEGYYLNPKLGETNMRFGEGFCSEVEICANWKSFLGFLELYLLSYMKKFICHEYLIDVCII